MGVNYRYNLSVFILSYGVLAKIVGVANMVGTTTASTTGLLLLVQSGTSSEVTVRGRISQLSAGSHAFHVHENGVLGTNCGGVGSHFNPTNVSKPEVLLFCLLQT